LLASIASTAPVISSRVLGADLLFLRVDWIFKPSGFGASLRGEAPAYSSRLGRAVGRPI